MDDRARPLDALVTALMPALQRMGERYMMRENPDHSFQSAGTLVSEAYIRVRQSGPATLTEADVLGLMSAAMRHILIDHGRGRRAIKRGARWRKVAFEEDLLATGEERGQTLVDLAAALAALADHSPRLARVVELRVFAGMAPGRVALALGVSPRQVRRLWSRALAWLQHWFGAQGAGAV